MPHPYPQPINVTLYKGKYDLNFLRPFCPGKGELSGHQYFALSQIHASCPRLSLESHLSSESLAAPTFSTVQSNCHLNSMLRLFLPLMNRLCLAGALTKRVSYWFSHFHKVAFDTVS